MESLSGTAVSSTVAIVGSIWPKGPAQAGPATQARWPDPGDFSVAVAVAAAAGVWPDPGPRFLLKAWNK